jgi:hypothetical protein
MFPAMSKLACIAPRVAWKRFSGAPVRAARLAAFEEQRRRAEEWMKTIPETDYGAICDAIRSSAQPRRKYREDVDECR